MTANDKQIGGTHYKNGILDHWDWAVANDLLYLEGVLTKYVCRHKTSGKPDDRAKALHYAEKLLEVRQEGSWQPFLYRRPVQLMEELIAAYALTLLEEEICRLAARYTRLEDLEQLRDLCTQLTRDVRSERS